MGKVESPDHLHRDHRREEERQIYRIQRSPGKPGGFDALLLVLLVLLGLTFLRNGAEGFHTSAQMFNPSKIIKD